MNKVIVETSAHHVHLSEDHLEILFGKGAKLSCKRELSQPGQYVCMEKVDIVGPKNTIKNVSILGPTRNQTQVEISLTEARKIGIQVPIRESGNLSGSAACKLIGPMGEIELKEGVIAAARHIHLSPEDAEKFGIISGQNVSICIKDTDRPTCFRNVVARVSDKFNTAVHLDTDEANAAALTSAIEAELLIN